MKIPAISKNTMISSSKYNVINCKSNDIKKNDNPKSTDVTVRDFVEIAGDLFLLFLPITAYEVHSANQKQIELLKQLSTKIKK